MEKSSLNIGSFGLMVQSDNQKINLTTLTNEFKLDVRLSDSKIFLSQKQDGIITSVSDSYIKLCNNKKKDKHVRPQGFVKIQYSKNKSPSVELEIAGRKTITRPPIGPIFEGTWCYSCKNKGPFFHKENCRDPFYNSLKLTLYGFILCINAKTKKAKKNIPEIQNLKNKLNNIIEDQNKTQILTELQKRTDLHDLFYNYKQNQDEWPQLLIDYNTIQEYLGFKVKKDKSFFSNCAIVSYNFPLEDKSVSVRIYESSTIHLVSCPWNHKEFYKTIIEKINDTNALSVGGGKRVRYNIDDEKTNLTNVFTYLNLIQPDKALQLEYIYKYLWPIDQEGNPSLSNNSPKRVYTKVYSKNNKEVDHNYLVCDTEFYRYTIDYRVDLSTPKIILKLIPCVTKNDIPDYCKPYKFSIIIFTSGKVQSTFSFCKNDDDNDRAICDSYFVDISLEEQFKLVENESKKIYNFLECLLKPIEDNIIIEKPSTINKDTIDTTVAGIVPYKKKDKLKIGEKVDIFDSDIMDWDSQGEVIEIKNNDISVKNIDDKDEKMLLTQQDLRAVKQSPMGLAKDPEPYLFNGECKEGDNYFVPFGGTQARDNLYYPYCAKKTKDKYNLYINQILKGFPLDEEDVIKFKIDRQEPYDKFSGIFEDTSLTEIGNEIEFIDPETDEELTGVIISKNKTHNKGLDNVIQYQIQIGDNPEDIRTITGKDFSLKYRQDRRWEGIQGDELTKKLKLINCAEKLGLAQSPYLSKSLDSRLQNKLLQEIHKLLPGYPPREYCGKKISVLTPKILENFSRRAYCGLVIPNNSQRVLLYATPYSQYFIDETLLIMNLEFDNIESTFILDGYLIKQKDILRYYPIDCIYQDEKLNINYIDENPIKSRLYYTIDIARHLNKNNRKLNIKIESPEEYISPKISKQNILGNCEIPEENFTEIIKKRSIINDIHELLKLNETSSEIVFIPQSGTSNYMKWKKQLKTPIVLESIKKIGTNEYTFGIRGKTIKPLGDTPINIKSMNLNKRTKILVRFDLNFTSDGKLNSREPLILNINPAADPIELLSHERTQLIVDAMLYPIPEKMFRSITEWEIHNPRTIKLFTQDFNPGINKLLVNL